MQLTQKPRLHQDWIDPHAFGIVKALQRKGFTTYLVGGCVRDLLIGIHPKDYDIGTSAQPQEVKRVIYRSFIIGKRFRLVLIKRDDQQYEVATFRREAPPPEPISEETLKAAETLDVSAEEESPAEAAATPTKEERPETFGDNYFGTPEEDAKRRDFTINSLFYDPVQDQLLDTCEGMKDLEQRWIRMIGDPKTRLIEDPIRILRGVRLAHKLEFSIEPSLRKAMQEHGSCLKASALPRRREEYLKILRLPDPSLVFLELWDLGLLEHILPTLNEWMKDPEFEKTFLFHLREYHDRAVDKSSPLELFGLFLFAVLRAQMGENFTDLTKWKEYTASDAWLKFMRDELGLFKNEQALALKAMHMQSLLARRVDFEKRGDRRRMAMLRTEAFWLALRMAERDYHLSGMDLYFWQTLARQKPTNPVHSDSN